MQHFKGTLLCRDHETYLVVLTKSSIHLQQSSMDKWHLEISKQIIWGTNNGLEMYFVLLFCFQNFAFKKRPVIFSVYGKKICDRGQVMVNFSRHDFSVDSAKLSKAEATRLRNT